MMAKQPPQRSRLMSPVLIWIVVILTAYAAWVFLNTRRQNRVNIEYSEFRIALDSNNVASVAFSDHDLNGELKNPQTLSNIKVKSFHTTVPVFEGEELMNALRDHGVHYSAKSSTPWGSILLNIVPWLLMLGFLFLFLRRMSSGTDRAFTFGKSRARVVTEDRPKVTFNDVAGVEEAKEELQEVIEFLMAP